MVSFGTLAPETSPRFISGPAWSRIDSSRERNSAFASSSDGLSVPSTPRSAARITTTGIPLSIIVTSTVSMTSTGLEVGSSEPHDPPAMSEKSIWIAAAVPGTPSIAASPAYSGRPSRSGNVAVAKLSVLTMKMRTDAVEAAGAGTTSRRSTANGPIPASRFPQFC